MHVESEEIAQLCSSFKKKKKKTQATLIFIFFKRGFRIDWGKGFPWNVKILTILKDKRNQNFKFQALTYKRVKINGLKERRIKDQQGNMHIENEELKLVGKKGGKERGRDFGKFTCGYGGSEDLLYSSVAIEASCLLVREKNP